MKQSDKKLNTNTDEQIVGTLDCEYSGGQAIRPLRINFIRMNKFALFVFGLIIFLQFNGKAQTVGAYFDYAPFYSKDVGTYVETYISLHGKSLRYVLNADSVLEASVEATMLFKNADDIIEFRKYKFVSPPIIEPTEGFPDFIDLQRISIPEGIYNFELLIKDNNGADSIKAFKTSQLLMVDIPANDMALSGIEFVERYETSVNTNIYMKDSMECIPFVSDNFTKNINYLRFYAELYSAAKGIGAYENFSLAFHIEETHTGKPIKEFSSFSSQRAVNKNVIFKALNIKKLPTGNYYLVIEVRDKQNNILLVSKKFFQRTNYESALNQIDLKTMGAEKTFTAQYTNVDTLSYYLKALKPISDLDENLFIDNVLNHSNLKLMQQFFYNFWKLRDEQNPQMKWNEYLTNINYVEQQFKTSNQNGFATPRGNVYLQLGPPNSVAEVKSGTAVFPNQVWDYYKIANQTNIQFIFFNDSQIPNSYKLLHTNMKGF